MGSQRTPCHSCCSARYMRRLFSRMRLGSPPSQRNTPSHMIEAASLLSTSNSKHFVARHTSTSCIMSDVDSAAESHAGCCSAVRAALCEALFWPHAVDHAPSCRAFQRSALLAESVPRSNGVAGSIGKGAISRPGSQQKLGSKSVLADDDVRLSSPATQRFCCKCH